MHTNLSSTFQLVYKFVHPWPPRWCTNLYILDLLGGVQICTPLTSQMVYKFVHHWPPRWCTNLYILDRTSQMVYKFVHPRPPTSQIANYLNICDTGLHRTTKKQECWWCWSFNSECWRSCCCVLWKLCTRASYWAVHPDFRQHYWSKVDGRKLYTSMEALEGARCQKSSESSGLGRSHTKNVNIIVWFHTDCNQTPEEEDCWAPQRGVQKN